MTVEKKSYEYYKDRYQLYTTDTYRKFGILAPVHVNGSQTSWKNTYQKCDVCNMYYSTSKCSPW